RLDSMKEDSISSIHEEQAKEGLNLSIRSTWFILAIAYEQCNVNVERGRYLLYIAHPGWNAPKDNAIRSFTKMITVDN
ncbi:hypothetical protein KI387_014103, partial [Taxus chinensis]